jgi:metal transporter CNNM
MTENNDSILQQAPQSLDVTTGKEVTTIVRRNMTKECHDAGKESTPQRHHARFIYRVILIALSCVMPVVLISYSSQNNSEIKISGQHLRHGEGTWTRNFDNVRETDPIVADDAYIIRSDFQFQSSQTSHTLDFGSKCDDNCCAERWADWDAADLNRTHYAPQDHRHRRLQEASFPLPPWASYLVVIGLTCCSALFSGLTLGLLGLDKTGLEIIMDGDDLVAAKQAKRLAPVRENGNLLLCTLLLGNVSVNALLSIVMADIAGGLTGFFVSTAILVVFGEIIPQAVCSRFALEIGSRAVPIVKLLIALFFPIAYPLAWMLNKALGHELGTIYSKAEFVKLLEIHAERGGFNKEMTSAMTGALKYQDLKVEEVMTPWDKVFTLAIDENLSYETIVAVFKTGYSRIPIYEGNNRSNVIGLLFVKDLIFVDPEDETPLRNFVRIFGRGESLRVPRVFSVERKIQPLAPSNAHSLFTSYLFLCRGSCGMARRQVG